MGTALLRSWRESRGWSQTDLALQLGLKSKGHVSRLESGAETISTDQAIAIDRLSAGEVTVAQLRPDLDDVRVLRPEERGACA